MQMSDLTNAPARVRIWRDRRWEAAGLLPAAMSGALGCESGERGQVAAAVERIPPEMAISTEAHHANVRFNSCPRQGTNLARGALEGCRTAAYTAMPGALGRESGGQWRDLAILPHIRARSWKLPF